MGAIAEHDSVTVLVWLAGSAVLPTLVLRMNARVSSSPASRVAAWCCAWASQLAVPLLAIAVLSLYVGRELYRSSDLAAAMVYGGGGAIVTATLASAGVDVLRAGTSIVRGRHDASARCCVRAIRRQLSGLAGVAGLCGAMFVLPIPGFGGLFYAFMVIAPASAGGVLMLLVTGGTLRGLRRAR